jgi:uncharacterized membrane protein YgcG
MLRLILLIVFFPLVCFGQIPDPKPDTYINDYTNNLQPGEIQKLNEKILHLEKETTVQLAILLINDLPGGMSLEDFARTVGNRWKVGNNHNGLVYVAALNERKHRLEVARNLEGEIPDIKAFTIIEGMKPYLAAKEYYNALELLISSLEIELGAAPHMEIDSTYNSNDTTPNILFEEVNNGPLSPELQSRMEFETRKAKYDRLGNYAIGGIVLGLLGFSIWAWRFKKRYIKQNTVNGVYLGIGSSYFASTYGDYFDSDSSGSSGFGGFGGDGGGGFSGGGASGDW